MTIIPSQYNNWQQESAASLATFNRLSPRLRLVRDAAIAKFHVADIGGYGVRTIRDGVELSSHAFGAAQDLSYRGLGTTVDARRAAAAPLIQWLIDNSGEFGVQAVHDYLNCRIWHPNRDPKDYPDGWKLQAPSASGMGQTWADWIHVEIAKSRWYDTTPLEPQKPAWPTIGYGSSGPLVAAVQTILREGASQDVGASDGKWGSRTQAGWNNVVAYVPELSRDAYVNGDDWKVIAWIDRGWARLYAAGFPG